MSKFKVTDFYYGAVLSMLINRGITPALVESNNDRQVYDFSTDNDDFRLFIKYRAQGRISKNGDYRSWQFVFTAEDISKISEYLGKNRNLLLALVCGAEKLDESELAVIQPEEIQRCFECGKTSLTISRIKREKAFRISIGGGRSNSIKIPCNRLIGER
ncbi:hypothetical protein [Thermincola potens]|uniref:Uncharacterized protein n=1 Tax=Thermincola potens (strain JR) TaxID=635013 RepID=D5XE62_THEPJ|nr:hypothetical protein [Thermincola potens]ADG81933.1 conserved hypothetical protein [Thermincola potens JR]